MEHEGYRYVRNGNRGNTTYYSCALKNSHLCKASLKVVNGIISTLKPHTGHFVVPDTVRGFRRTVVERAIRERTSLRNIYDEEAARNQNAAAQYSWPTASSVMSSARRQNNPTIPATLQAQLNDARLHMTDDMQDEPDNVPEEENNGQEIAQNARVEPNRCVICLLHEPTHAVVPCGHKCMCLDCATAAQMQDLRICPVCRDNLQLIIRIY